MFFSEFLPSVVYVKADIRAVILGYVGSSRGQVNS